MFNYLAPKKKYHYLGSYCGEFFKDRFCFLKRNGKLYHSIVLIFEYINIFNYVKHFKNISAF